MKYRFRLTVHSPRRGFFYIDEVVSKVKLTDDIELAVYPRDGATLKEASKYHFEAGGFATEEEALLTGEETRKRLRILICLLDLPLIVPQQDAAGASITDEALRSELEADSGVHILDSRRGLWTLPDDEKYVEFILNGRAETFPVDPLYLLNAIKKTWEHQLDLNDASTKALELLSLTIANGTPTAKFQMAYLALEPLIPRVERSSEARALLAELKESIKSSGLPEHEKDGLAGALGDSIYMPFSASFRRFVALVTNPPEIDGILLEKLASDCIGLRNAIAHKASPDDKYDIPKLESALRKFVLHLIWTTNYLPSFSVYRSGDAIGLPELNTRLM